MINSNDIPENINIETGNFSIFPIQYLKGGAPVNEQQIALSYLNSHQLGKKVGDPVSIFVEGNLKEVTVSGIYQDITNGGLTAKALFRSDPATVFRYVINVDFYRTRAQFEDLCCAKAPGLDDRKSLVQPRELSSCTNAQIVPECGINPQVNIQNKVKEYTAISYPARVTDIDVYLSQTLGDLIGQIKVLTILAMVLGVFVSALIAALFLKMMIAKDYRQIAIMKAIGFSVSQLRVQYLTRVLSVLVVGILLGSIAANTLGQTMIGLMWSLMGAPEIKFIIEPVVVYIFCPLVLIVVVATTTFFSMTLIDKVKITEMVVE